jgi:hypothetical protein
MSDGAVRAVAQHRHRYAQCPTLPSLAVLLSVSSVNPGIAERDDEHDPAHWPTESPSLRSHGERPRVEARWHAKTTTAQGAPNAVRRYVPAPRRTPVRSTDAHCAPCGSPSRSGPLSSLDAALNDSHVGTVALSSVIVHMADLRLATEPPGQRPANSDGQLSRKP